MSKIRVNHIYLHYLRPDRTLGLPQMAWPGRPLRLGCRTELSRRPSGRLDRRSRQMPSRVIVMITRRIKTRLKNRPT